MSGETRTLTLGNTKFDLEMNWCADDRLGHHKNVFQTNDND